MERLAHRANIRQQVGVGQHHAFRVAGASRRILQKRQVFAANDRPRAAAGVFAQFRHGHDVTHAASVGAQEPRRGLRRRHCHQRHTSGVVENPGVSPQVVLDLVRPRRGIDRHRDAAGHLDAEKCMEELQ